MLVCRQLLVFGVVEENWPEVVVTTSVAQVHFSVHVVEERVTVFKSSDCCSLVRLRETIYLLLFLAAVVVVSCKRVECAELEPTGAKLVGSISAESANVCSRHLHAKNIEVENGDYRVTKILPSRVNVARPVGTVFSTSRKRTPRKDKRKLLFVVVFSTRIEVVVSCSSHHQTVQVVQVVLH